MTAGLMGRQKKAAKRRNYKISFDVLARLQAIAVIEDRTETAQLERAIRDMADTWESANTEELSRYNSLVEAYLKAEGEVNDDE
jgi:predicted transcriptional regulator